jgi:hypothetical protein
LFDHIEETVFKNLLQVQKYGMILQPNLIKLRPQLGELCRMASQKLCSKAVSISLQQSQTSACGL